jgi:hypothetical protein
MRSEDAWNSKPENQYILPRKLEVVSKRFSVIARRVLVPTKQSLTLFYKLIL